MQWVYIRYLYTYENLKHTMNFETDCQVTKEQIIFLIANQQEEQ